MKKLSIHHIPYTTPTVEATKDKFAEKNRK
jgi:hypothetical protein